MRLIGVIDLCRGRAVHARGGRRERYAPVERVAGVEIEPGDAVALARTYVDVLGVRDLYVADLDAITHAAPQREVVAALCALGVPVSLDAGVASAEAAKDAELGGVATIVVGLETLGSFAALGAICEVVGGARVVFSLDLRDGEPIYAPDSVIERGSASALAASAAAAGTGAIIVLDLARVGTGGGPDVARIDAVRAAAPGVTLIGGGGVRGYADVERLAAAGCDGVLVATALHDGRLGATAVAAAEQLGRSGRDGAIHA